MLFDDFPKLVEGNKESVLYTIEHKKDWLHKNAVVIPITFGINNGVAI